MCLFHVSLGSKKRHSNSLDVSVPTTPSLLYCFSIVLQLSRALREHARSIPGKSQLFINAFAKALEVGG